MFRRKGSVLVLFAVLYGVVIYHLVGNYREKPPEKEAEVAPELAAPVASVPVSEQMAPEDRSVLSSVYHSPEVLDSSVTQPGVEIAAPVSIAMRDRTMPPVENTQYDESSLSYSGEAPAFWNDFASIRTDEVRNPDSELNQQKVISIMKMRQRRLGQVAN